MAEEGDDSDDDKTEEPTARRLEDAAKRGQIPFSRELVNVAMLIGLLTIINSFYELITTPSLNRLAGYIANAGDQHLANDFSGLFTRMVYDTLVVIAIPLAIAVAIALAANLLQYRRLLWSLDKIEPKLEKISPMSGFKRIFSKQSVVELIKSISKFAIITLVAYFAIKGSHNELAALFQMPAIATALLAKKLVIKALMFICILMCVIAGLDYLFQYRSIMQKLRMSKREIKEEMKQQEGNPEIKAKRRQIARERARTSLREVVPKADVVITNPTHYSIVLSYNSVLMNAPKIVAMGIDDVALVIRELAAEAEVPCISNPPLARQLYKDGNIDQEIPLDHFEAVAKIISYVYQLKGKKL